MRIATQHPLIQERRLLACFSVNTDEQHATLDRIQTERQVVGVGEDFGRRHLDGVSGIGGSLSGIRYHVVWRGALR